jgi:AcrR family transcriptional regulator
MTVPITPDKPYHHGDLRQALLDAALLLSTEQGIDGFTLREVARRAGVSHAAPYRHFADKGALVEALATEGWYALAHTLEKAWRSSEEDSLGRVVGIGRTYVQFALRRPAEFRLMVRPELHHSKRHAQAPTPLQQAAQQSANVLIQGIAQGQADGLIVSDNLQGLALTCWSAMHGLAVILLDGLMTAGTVDEQMAELVAQTLIRGLAVR